jgi:hypothetical protein
MAENLTPDDYHRHEALHVVHLVRNLIDAELESHPYVQCHPDLIRFIRAAQDALGDAYQYIGERSFGADSDSQG